MNVNHKGCRGEKCGAQGHRQEDLDSQERYRVAFTNENSFQQMSLTLNLDKRQSSSKSNKEQEVFAWCQTASALSWKSGNGAARGCCGSPISWSTRLLLPGRSWYRPEPKRNMSSAASVIFIVMSANDRFCAGVEDDVRAVTDFSVDESAVS